MADTDKIIMFPENGMNGNGGYGYGLGGWGGGILGFLLGALIGNNGLFGGGGLFGNNNFGGAGYVANALNNDSGREAIMNAINGSDADVRFLASTLNSDVNTVKANLATISSSIATLSGQTGMNALQITNAIQSGNSALASQLYQCCCENKLLTTQQGYESRIQTIEQTNQLGSQSDRNTAALNNSIANLQTNMTKEFCELRDRELQNKIDALNTENAVLRTNINNAAQTAQIAQMMAPMQAQINRIEAAQPQTITLPLNNYQAIPSLVANLGTGFVSSYWADRLFGATNSNDNTNSIKVSPVNTGA